MLQLCSLVTIDMYYGKDFPVYHTAFHSYDWMVNSGGPLFHWHVAVTGVWGLIGLHLADDAILRFNYLSYARQLLIYWQQHSLEPAPEVKDENGPKSKLIECKDSGPGDVVATYMNTDLLATIEDNKVLSSIQSVLPILSFLFLLLCCCNL